MLAIQRAVTACASDPPGEQITIGICTDSQSAVHHLRQGPSGEKGQAAQDIWAGIRNLATMGHNVHVQWVPNHAGLDGNEAADAAARAGTQLEQRTVAIELRCAQGHLERHFSHKWEASYSTPSTSDASSSANWFFEAFEGQRPTPVHDMLPRSHQRVLNQLRAGKCPITDAYLHAIGKAPSDICQACHADPRLSDT